MNTGRPMVVALLAGVLIGLAVAVGAVVDVHAPGRGAFPAA
jgi:hypothetical protein